MQYKQKERSWRIIIDPEGLQNDFFKEKITVNVE